MKQRHKIIIVGFPIFFLTILGFAYIEALGSITNSKSIEYREDCYDLEFQGVGGSMYNTLCDLRDQNEKLIEQNKQIIAEEQKQTKLLDQIDCYNFFYYANQRNWNCGIPLNLTGVWTP